MTRAVVLGAGIAGLLSARVLADRYDEVTIVERDDSPVTGPRRGVPQGEHVHSLLDGGRRLIEEFHPGLSADLRSAGAPSGEPLRDTKWFLHGRRLAGRSTGLVTVLLTRPLLESVLREKTLETPGIELVFGSATGLVARGPDAIGGVRLRESDQELEADLVVDASGRASRLPDWLGQLGHPKPAEQRVDVDLGYTTRMYRREPGAEYLAAIVSTVPHFRGGALLAVEDDRWMVTLAGMLGDHPPADPAAFTAWAATLPVPDVAEVTGSADPLGDPHPYRFRGSRWRRYDRIRLPEGLIVVGDSVCSLNPLYAQGMTLAALQVKVLQQHLAAEQLMSNGFQRAAGRTVAAAWDVATRADLALPGVEGRRPVAARLLDAYVGRVQRAAHHDPALARAFLRVANLVDPAPSLLRPALVMRALRHGSRASRPAAGAEPVRTSSAH